MQDKEYGSIHLRRFTITRAGINYEILAGNLPASMILNIPVGTKLIMIRHPYEGIGLFPNGITLQEVKRQFPVYEERAKDLAVILSEILFELQIVVS
jgi:hypothetical protein